MKSKNQKCINCNNPCRFTYCSNKCQAAMTVAHKLDNWIANPTTVFNKNGLCPKFIKDFFRAIFGDKCQLCSWSHKNPVTNKVPLEMNHIDGNGFNNKLDNLQLICPNCHSLTPNFKALNKKSMRKR